MTKIAVIGGGAAGFFYAINKATFDPQAQIIIFEQSKNVLNKVKISGGGRCNVTHACFDPRELVQNYPRGSKELLGPFNSFACGDTIAWFDERGIELKIEEDGRMFPITNSSQTIIDCFMSECERLNITIKNQCKVKNLVLSDNEKWQLDTSEGLKVFDLVFLGTGSSPFFWDILKNLGHHIVDPVPSLFTFNIRDKSIKDLPGISVPNAVVTIPKFKLEAFGPLLVTHWGLSGPAILKLSAWGARFLKECDYIFDIFIDWVPHISDEQIEEIKKKLGGKFISDKNPFSLPNRLWQNLILDSSFQKKRWADLSKSEMIELKNTLKRRPYSVKGKSTFKSEFVTAGGVDLKEINFKDFSSKLLPNLYLAGEVINIDAITGGFNFQAAWTGAYLASKA